VEKFELILKFTILLFQALKMNMKSWKSLFSNVIGSISKTFGARSFFH